MFYSLFEKHAHATPNKIAVNHNGTTISYGDMQASIDKLTRNLIANAFAPGDRVAVCLDNGIRYLVLYYALARIGATVVPFTSTTSPQEIELFCRECRPQHYIVNQQYHDKFQAVIDRLEQGRLVSDQTAPVSSGMLFDSNDNSNTVIPEKNWAGHDMVIHYNTANSADEAEKFKGAVQTQSSHTNRMLNWIDTAHITASDRTLCMHPLMHAFGSDMFAFPALSSGHTLYLMGPADVTPANVAKAIDQHEITLFGALPWLYKELVDLAGREKYDLSSLRIAMCAATPLPIDVANDFLRIYKKRVNNSYGLTETSLIATNFFSDGSNDLLTVGRPIANVGVKIIECGSGLPGIGELLVRSNGFAVRYFSPEVKPLVRDGWIHTGDLVRLSESGDYYIEGRVSQVISTPDGKFLPLEVEEAIARLPEVKEVAVVPIVTESGEHVAAFIVRSGLVTAADIRNHIATRLAAYKVPASIQFRDSLPKSATGKISRAKLHVTEA